MTILIGGGILKQTKEERIQQIKDCGQAIIDNAAEIYGEFCYPTDLEIVVKFERGRPPTVEAKREFIPETFVARIV